MEVLLQLLDPVKPRGPGRAGTWRQAFSPALRAVGVRDGRADVFPRHEVRRGLDLIRATRNAIPPHGNRRAIRHAKRDGVAGMQRAADLFDPVKFLRQRRRGIR